MDGFEKIDLNTSQSSSSKIDKIKSLFTNKKTRVGSFVVLFLFILSIFTIILPAQATYGSVKKTNAQAKVLIAAVKNQNVELADQELAKLNEDLKDTQKNLRSLFILRFIPIAWTYYDDADHLVKAGFHGLEAADILIESVKPYADVLGLKGQGSFVGGTAEQRVETAVKTMGKVTPRIDEIAEKFTAAQKEIDNINPNDYPAFLAGGKLKNEVVKLRAITDDGAKFVNDAKPLIKILPELLGEPKEKKYLVLFQNDKELRATGGFITAYSIFRVERGIIHVDLSNNIYALDNTVRNKEPAPRPIKEYLPKVPLFHIRDSNLSPDFVNSMETFLDMYERSSGPDVDGIIAVDTHALVGAMNILGDIQAGGTTFKTTEDPRCSCPQVIYELERIVGTPQSFDLRITDVVAVNLARKSIIGDLMYAIMNKAFSSSPKLYWGPLFQEMINQTAQKHILFYVFNDDAQKGLEGLNVAGRIKAFEGDYLHINESNFGGAKSNMFVSEEVMQDISVGNDGKIKKTITINYKNPHPPSDCNLERGGLCLNATLRDWIRVYVPKGSKLVASTGSEVKMITYDELGKTVFEGFLTVRPKGSAKLTLSYELPFKLDRKSDLPLLIQKQPGTEGHKYTINLNGKKVEEFKLLDDKTIKLDI